MRGLVELVKQAVRDVRYITNLVLRDVNRSAAQVVEVVRNGDLTVDAGEED